MEKSHIPKVNVGIPTEISTTPLPDMEDYKVELPVTQDVTPPVKTPKKAGIFNKIITWLLSRKSIKHKLIAYAIIGIRQVIWPFDVYKVNDNGEWVLDEDREIQNVEWASNIAKIGSFVTFIVAWIFNEPIKDFTGKGVIEWIQLLLN